MIDPVEAERIRLEYGLTQKQAGAIAAYVYGGANSMRKAIEEAGYKSSEAATGLIASPKGSEALEAETRRKLELEQKTKRFQTELEQDARGAIKKKLVEHAEDKEVTPNQTRAVELLAKLEGLMVERVEVDPGEFFRSKLGQDLFPAHLLLEQKPQE